MEAVMTEREQQERLRFSELLPFWVNGTLDTAERQWVEDYRLGHPETQSEIEFTTHLQSASQNVTSKVPESQRLQRVLESWQASRPPPSLVRRLRDMMLRPARIPTAAFATIAILFVAQSALLITEMRQPEQEMAYRGDKSECQTTTSRLRVVFTPDARHVEIVLLLRKLETTVREGPSETGEFWLSVPAGRSLDDALAMLRTSALVEEVMLVRESRVIPGCTK
jgi:hypothetical protein